MRCRWRRRVSISTTIIVIIIEGVVMTCVGLILLSLRSVDVPFSSSSSTSGLLLPPPPPAAGGGGGDDVGGNIGMVEEWGSNNNKRSSRSRSRSRSCATVEEMGKPFKRGPPPDHTLRLRRILSLHFLLNGADRVRNFSPEQFCRHGFVLAKASEAGFGNEMYKILNAAALSVMLNRSLIIGQTRGHYPFGDYISYSNRSFTLKEVKHLWRQNGCVKRYGRHLVMRIDDFGKPTKTNVLCSNWRKWKQAIIWFQNTTDAVATQFFLKNIHPEMKAAAIDLFGQPELLQSRPNVFGELMKILISPSKDVEEAVNWVLGNGTDPHISLHMRMLMNRSVRALQAALNCIKRAVHHLPQVPRPRVVLISDTPPFVKSILANIAEFAEVLHFDYKRYQGNISQDVNTLHNLAFRVKDWGPAPRWAAFVDFFLASRAKNAVVSGAHRRVGTTYAQLIAALAAANNLEETNGVSNFTFLSSFQSNLLADGLRLQAGWGHVWNRFAGPLSCKHQSNQCAFTPLLPPAWWDGLWQSPIPRDIRRLADFGIKLTGFGTIDESSLQSHCKSKRVTVKTIVIL